MGILGGVVCPHPPLLIPTIGGERVKDVRHTQAAMEEAAQMIHDLDPETLVFISPHSVAYDAAFAVRVGTTLTGSFSAFGRPDVKFTLQTDSELAQTVVGHSEAAGMPVIAVTESQDLDWGVLVPYYFIGGGRRVVSLSISSLGLNQHRQWGNVVATAAGALERRTVFVASGDLSHRLSADGPYGFSPDGQPFDQTVTEIFSSGRLGRLIEIDQETVAGAGECGLRSFVTLSGVLKESSFSSRLLSYEAPFGVGYAVAIFVVEGDAYV